MSYPEEEFEYDDESWEEAKQDYLEELEELGWDWDAWDPCTD